MTICKQNSESNKNNEAENPKKNLFFKTFVNVPGVVNEIGFEDLYKKVKMKAPTSINDIHVDSVVREKISHQKLFEAKWNKSSQISLSKNSSISNMQGANSQPLFNFLYSRNYFDYCSDSDMLFTKTTLKELLNLDERENTSEGKLVRNKSKETKL